MIEGLFHYQVLNIIINALLAFLTTSFLIEGVLKIFKFKHPRLKSLIRLIPLFKLPLDVFIADWPRWALLHGINPLYCEGGTRMLFIGCTPIDVISSAIFIPVALRIGFELAGGYSFSIVDMLSPLINLELVRAISITFIALTLFQVLFLCIETARDYRKKREFLKRCYPCIRPVENLLIKKSLLVGRIEVFSHPEYDGSPLLIGSFRPKIIFPEMLLIHLDQKEFEAILSHEIQHAKNRDILVRGLIGVIKKLFWWIPTGRLINSIELQQEYACDQNCLEYNINPVDLASGIVKVAKFGKSPGLCSGAYLFRRKLLKKRIHQLLDSVGNKKRSWQEKVLFFFGYLVMFTVFFGKFWIV